jgi:WD40 repeat protein
MTLEFERTYGYDGDAIAAFPNGEYAFPSATGVYCGAVNAEPKLWICGDGIHRVSKIFVHPKRHAVYITEKRLKVSIIAYSWPQRRQIQKLNDAAKVDVAGGCFCRDGTLFALLADAPNCNVIMFSVDINGKLQMLGQPSKPHLHQFQQISFNPAQKSELCASGGGHLCFWRHTTPNNALVPTEGRVTAANVRLTAHAWLPSGEVVCGTHNGQIYSFVHENALGRVTFQLPTEDPVVSIIPVSHFVAVAQSTGSIHLIDDKFVEVIKTIPTGIAELRHLVLFPEWHSYYVCGRSQACVLHMPGSERASIDELRLATAKIATVHRSAGSEIVGVCFLKGTKVAFVSKRGQLTVLDYHTNTFSMQVAVGEHPTGMKLLGESVIAVTSGHGTLRLVDVSKKAESAIVLRAKVSDSSLTVCEVDPSGTRLMASDGKSIYFFSLNNDVFDFDGALRTNIQSVVVNLLWYPQTQAFLLVQQSGDVHMFNLPTQFDRDRREASTDGLFINSWRLDFPVTNAIIVAGLEDSANLFVQSLDKESKLYVLDRTLLPERKDRESKTVKPQFSMKDHDKRGTKLMMWKEKLLISSGSDGKIVIRDVSHYTGRLVPTATSKEKKDALCSAVRHVSLAGGVSDFSVSHDNLRLVSAGFDQNLCFWSLTRTGVAPPFSMPTEVRNNVTTLEAEEELFFVDKSRKQAEELDRIRHAEHRQAVANTVARLRQRLEAIRKENDEAAPEEQVALRDFLVAQQKDAFEEECAVAIQEMSESEHYKNLERDYIIDIIRKECWDVMDVKLTTCRGMMNKSLEVQNFHLRKVPQQDLAILRKLKFLRLVEQRDRELNKITELEDIQEQPPPPPDAAAKPGAPAVPTDPPPPPPQLGARSLEDEAAEDPQPYLYNPLLVFTRFRAIVQMRLLASRLSHVKGSFNKGFSDLIARKKADIMKIEERNVRCRQVLKELDEKRDLFSPSFAKDENPNSIFVVEDSEVAADKSTDPDEKKRLAAEAEEKRRWIERHGSDDSADKALKAWMDGRLDKEVRTLDVKIDIPEFADDKSEKFVIPEERSEDQQRIFKEYEKALAKRVEEVTARRSSLQAELEVLHKDNVETAKKFDVALLELHGKRMTSSQRCHEVELAQIKLSQIVLLHEERQRLAAKMEQQRQVISEKHQRAIQATNAAKTKAADTHAKLEELRESEKNKEKNVRAQEPFDDPEFGEQLVRFFTKKKPKKENKKKQDDKAMRHGAKDDPVDSPDPFAFVEANMERRQRQYNEDPAFAVSKMDQPEGIPDELWDAFQRYRSDRANAEKAVAMLTDDVAECNAEVMRLQCIQDELAAAEKDAFAQFEQFQRDSLLERFDIEELRSFRQGQVEVEQAPVVTDYADSVLVHVSQIERLNNLIRASGSEKVMLLREISDKKKEIRLIEWELEHLAFCMQTFEMELRHLHTLRVTKQMQEFINGGGEDHNEKEREKIYHRIEHVRATMSQKIEDRRQQMLKLRRQVKDKELENVLLMEQVGESKTVVDERKAIRDLQSGDLDQERTNRLMRDMRVTRKLEDVAKAQLEEMVVLKKEIDRLRERTFPSFAVVSKRVMGNPDQL